MTQREKLRDHYEDALFALLMDEFAEQEGKRLLEENKRLQQDSDMVISGELDKRCIKTIHQSFAKGNRRRWKYAISKTVQRIAVAVLVVVILFGTAYAAFPEVRIRTLNLMIELSDKATSLTLAGREDNTQGDGKTPPSPNEDGTLRGYRLPEMPEGYEVSEAGNNSVSAWIEYSYVDGSSLYFFINSAEGSVLNIDTENATGIENISINGYEGLLVEKDNRITITWGDTDQNNFITILCTGVDRVQAIQYAEEIKFTNNS